MLEGLIEKMGRSKLVQIVTVASLLGSSTAIAKPGDYSLRPEGNYTLKAELFETRKKDYLDSELELSLKSGEEKLDDEPRCPPYLDPDLCWEKPGKRYRPEESETRERTRRRTRPRYEPAEEFPSYEPSYDKSNKDNDGWGWVLVAGGAVSLFYGGAICFAAEAAKSDLQSWGEYNSVYKKEYREDMATGVLFLAGGLFLNGIGISLLVD